MKQLSKRGLALLLALVMCLGMLQITAFADETETAGSEGIVDVVDSSSDATVDDSNNDVTVDDGNNDVTVDDGDDDVTVDDGNDDVTVDDDDNDATVDNGDDDATVDDGDDDATVDDGNDDVIVDDNNGGGTPPVEDQPEVIIPEIPETVEKVQEGMQTMAARATTRTTLTINVRVYSMKDGSTYNVGTDSVSAGSPALIQSTNYVIPQLTKFVAANTFGKVDHVAGNWYFPSTISQQPGININWSTNVGTGTMTYWVDWYNPNGGNLWDFTLKYDANGGSGAPDDQTWGTNGKYTKSHTFEISNKIPTRTDYTFKGWSDTKGGSVNYSASGSNGGKKTCMVSQTASGYNGGSVTKTLYAVWQKNPDQAEQVTLTYHANGGAFDDGTLEWAETKALTDGVAKFIVSSKEPTREDYNFLGWNADPDANKVDWVAGDGMNLIADTDLYAIWEKKDTTEVKPNRTLTLEKVFVDVSAGEVADFSMDYTVVCGENSYKTTFKLKDATFDKETMTATWDAPYFYNMGAKNTVTVVEYADVEGYTYTAEGSSGTVDGNTWTITLGANFSGGKRTLTNTYLKEAEDNGGGIEVEKTRVSINGDKNLETAHPGDEIEWEIKVTNNSNVTKTVKLTDSLINAALPGAELSKDTVVLAPGKSETVTATYTVTEDDVDKTIINTIVAETDKPGETEEDTDGGTEVKPATITVTWLDGYSKKPTIKQETVTKPETSPMTRDEVEALDPSCQYPDDPTREYYYFDGWGDPDADEDGNITITAQWKKLTYKVEWYVVDEEKKELFKSETRDGKMVGEEVSVTEADRTVEGYAYVGDNYDKDGIKNVLTAKLEEEGTVLKLYFTEEPLKPTEAKYTVEWYVVGKDGPVKTDTRTGTIGEKVEVKAEDKSYDDYVYVGDEDSRNVLSIEELTKEGGTLKLYFDRKTVTYTVVHEYYTNNSLTGSSRISDNGKVGDVISAANIAKITSYGGSNYTFNASQSDNSITLTDGGSNTITLRYYRTTGGGGGGGGGGGSTPTPKPTPTPTPTPTPDPTPDTPPVDVPEPDVPLVELPDEDVPLANIPEEEIPLAEIPEEFEIPEEEIPLANVPRTGDISALWYLATLMSAGILAFLGLRRKDR